MTPQEFQSAFNPIGSRWRKAYNADQVSLIHEAVKDFTFEQLKTVVNKLLGSQRLAPMVPDFERTFQELRFYPVYSKSTFQATPNIRVGEDFLYRVRDNIWANNTHVFIRGEKPSFILKDDEPENELVKEAEAVKKSRIAEIKSRLTKNSYAPYDDKENFESEGFRRMTYKGVV